MNYRTYCTDIKFWYQFSLRKSLDDTEDNIERYKTVIYDVVLSYAFGHKELFIIITENSGLISMNALPLSFRYKENKKIISNMNIVLEQIVPGLTIDIHDLGATLMKNEKTGRT